MPITKRVLFVVCAGLELGGLLGGTLSGWFSDKALKRAKGNGEGQVGKRVQIVMVSRSSHQMMGA